MLLAGRGVVGKKKCSSGSHSFPRKGAKLRPPDTEDLPLRLCVFAG
jgi:hypothetical protein